MRITDFELQTSTGQYWLDIVERITAKDAEIAKAQKATPRLARLLTAAQDALAAGDIDSLKAILFPVVEEEKLTEKERKLAEYDKQIATLTAERAKVAAEEAIKAEAAK